MCWFRGTEKISTKLGHSNSIYGDLWRTLAFCWRWVQAYAPELNQRCRPHLKPTNKSYRTDETYIKVTGEDKFPYRAVDSTGQTIEFLLTAKRDAATAKRFFRKALRCPGNPVPRVINVDKSPAFPPVVEALKAEGVLPRGIRLRQCNYLNKWNRIIARSRNGLGSRKATARFGARGEHCKGSKR
jgi:transposase-like protein